jgi:hypothetical protein
LVELHFVFAAGDVALLVIPFLCKILETKGVVSIAEVGEDGVFIFDDMYVDLLAKHLLPAVRRRIALLETMSSAKQ